MARSPADWKRWQDAIGEALKAAPVFYHRFYDTRAAQGYLPKQPADHLFLYRGLPVLLEDKYTEAVDTAEGAYATSLFDDTQLAKQRLWMLRGGLAFTTIHFAGRGEAELWESATIDRRSLKGGSLLHENPVYVEKRQKTLALSARGVVAFLLSHLDNSLKDVPHDRLLHRPAPGPAPASPHHSR